MEFPHTDIRHRALLFDDGRPATSVFSISASTLSSERSQSKDSPSLLALPYVD